MTTKALALGGQGTQATLSIFELSRWALNWPAVSERVTALR